MKIKKSRYISKTKNNSITEEERFRGWLLYSRLLEQVSKVNIGKAYLWKERLMQDVQNEIIKLAPHGVSSQKEFVEIVEKAIENVERKQRNKITQETEMVDVELTFNMIERTLKMIPYQVFFAAKQK